MTDDISRGGAQAQPEMAKGDRVDGGPEMSPELREKIALFLGGGKKPATGGWPEVHPEEVAQLYGVIRALVDERYSRDADGDAPIVASLTDRTRYQTHFIPVIRHVSQLEDEGAVLRAIDQLNVGVKSYAASIDTLVSLLREELFAFQTARQKETGHG